MANCCYTMYRLYGERAKELTKDIKRVMENHKNHDERWCKWLATDLLGYSEEQIIKGAIYVRGTFYVVNYDSAEEELMIDTDTAWNPCKELFDQLAEKYDLDIYWMADERGCVGIWSNDVDHHVWDWEYVVYNGDSGDEENFSFEEQAVEWVNDWLKEYNQPLIKHLSELDEDEDGYYDDWSVTKVEYNENY